MKQTWYIAVVRAVTYDDKTTRQEEIARIGPFTTKQLGPILKKMIYRPMGAIRIFQGIWQGENIL